MIPPAFVIHFIILKRQRGHRFSVVRPEYRFAVDLEEKLDHWRARHAACVGGEICGSLKSVQCAGEHGTATHRLSNAILSIERKRYHSPLHLPQGDR